MAQTLTNLPRLATGALVFTAENVLPPWGAGGADAAQEAPDKSGLMSREEAVAYLRLDEGRPMRAALWALTRLVKQGKIRPTLVSGRRMYLRAQLDRYLRGVTGKKKWPRKKSGGGADSGLTGPRG